MDRGRRRLPLRPHPSVCASSRARRPTSPPRSRRRSTRCNAEYAKLEAEYEDADELPDEVDAAPRRNRDGARRLRGSAGQSTIRPRSPAPASSSASTPTAPVASIAAMSGPRTRRRLPSDGDGEARGRRRSARRRRTGRARRAARRHHHRRPAAEPEEDEDDVVKPLPDRLVTRADRASDAGAARRAWRTIRMSR